MDISLETAAAVLSKFQQLQQSKNLISSILPDISVQNITTLLMPSYMNQEDDFKLLDDGIMNITVISEYLPSISALSISNASDTSTRNSTNNDSDSDSDIDDNSESVNVGVKDEVQILATQIDTVDDVIRNISGSEIRIDFKDYPQMPVTLLLQPANAASQLVASSKEGKSDALITSLSDLFNQTSSSSSSSESSPRAFTLSLATSAYMEPSVFSNDKASVREQMSILAQDMLKALLKAMVASGSDELLPSNISSEHIRIRLLSE